MGEDGVDLSEFGVDTPERDMPGREQDTTEDYKISRPQCQATTADGDRCSNPVRRTDGTAEFCPRHYDVEDIDQ